MESIKSPSSPELDNISPVLFPFNCSLSSPFAQCATARISRNTPPATSTLNIEPFGRMQRNASKNTNLERNQVPASSVSYAVVYPWTCHSQIHSFEAFYSVLLCPSRVLVRQTQKSYCRRSTSADGRPHVPRSIRVSLYQIPLQSRTTPSIFNKGGSL